MKSVFGRLCGAVLVAGLVCLLGCSNDGGEEEETTYTVAQRAPSSVTATFDLNAEDISLADGARTGEVLFWREVNGTTDGGYYTYIYYNDSDWLYRTSLLEPTRNGYALTNWNTQADGSGIPFLIEAYGNYTKRYCLTKAEEDDEIMPSTLTLYAQWEKVDYTVAFDANGGEGEMTSAALAYEETLSLPTSTFTRQNYVFAGWNTAADGSGTACADGETIKNLTKTNGAVVTLYAQWKPLSTISVDFADAKTLSLDSSYDYYEIVVSGEYSDLNMQHLLYVIKNTTPQVYLDLSAVTGDWQLSTFFQGMTNLVSISLPDTVTSIGSKAFSGCTALRKITLGNNVTSIGSQAFYNCSALTSITIPDSVTSIGDSAFSGTGLESMVIPDSVTTIGNSIDGCSRLTSITIGAGVTNISLADFSDCTALKTIMISEDNETYKVNDNIVYTKDGTQIIFCPAGKTGAIEIPDSVTDIGSSAFSGCSKITSMTIGENVQTIGSDAFYNCTGITTIEIPASVTKIGSYAFSECTALKTAFFAVATGWRCYGDNLTLSDAEQNALYLTKRYDDWTWTRE